jgi:hypothetical protein
MTLQFERPRPTAVRVGIFDVLGRRVADFDPLPREAGRVQLRFDTGRVAPGIYLCRIDTDFGHELRRIAVVR